MTDPYYKYAPQPIADPRYASAFPSYIPTETSALAPRSLLDPTTLRPSTEYPPNDLLSSRSRYGFVETAVVGVGSGRGFSPLEDPALIRRDTAAALGYERTEALGLAEGTNMLFVDGLPTNCTRREVGYLFRPFIGFKEIRVVHKEARI